MYNLITVMHTSTILTCYEACSKQIDYRRVAVRKTDRMSCLAVVERERGKKERGWGEEADREQPIMGLMLSDEDAANAHLIPRLTRCDGNSRG